MSNRDTEARTVVICGSMKNLELMTTIGDILRHSGLNAITPAPDERGGLSTTTKRAASRRHIDHIRHRRTMAILVVNVDRPEANNYVGPNSFAEIGIAFADERRVFLLQGMPRCYEDELVAWGVECLNGDLPRLVQDLGGREEIASSRWRDVYQHN